MFRPRHSSISLVVILGIFLFVTYFLFVPGIIKQYEQKLAIERGKLDRITTRLELHQIQLDKAVTEIKLNNRLLQEIYESVTRNRSTPSTKDH